MSSCNRRNFLGLSAAATLSACGFAPVYGPQGGGTKLLGAVRVDDPKTRDDFLFVRTMEDRLGRPSNERYGLSYAIKLSAEAVAISSNNVTTRYNLLGEVTFSLRDLETDQAVTSGKAQNFTGYSASGTTVSAQAAEKDARRRLMTILADDVTTRLTAAATNLS